MTQEKKEEAEENLSDDRSNEPGKLQSPEQHSYAVFNAQTPQLSDILSSIAEVVWSRRADDNTLVYINDACEAVYGYTKEELTGTTGKLEHIHPDDRQRLKEEIKKTKATGRGEMEYRVYHKDGTLRHLYGHGILKKGVEGAPDLINGVSTDITRLRETEQKLKDINREMEHIFESINDSFIALDHNFNFTYINKEAARIYNIQKEDLLHKNLWKLFPQGRKLKFYTELHRAMTDQVSVHFEEFSPSANIWVSINAYPTKNGLAIYFSDVTEQRKLQEQLINEGQKLLSIINNTKDIIWAFDKDMNIISANQAYYDRVAYMTGGKDYAALTSDDFGSERVAKWTAYFNRAFSGETFYVVEEEVYKNETIFEEISFNPIRNNDGNITGISCFSRNITEQHKQLARIQEQNEKLSEIAWLQSHQVRGPVATILGLIPLFNYENPGDKNNIEILEMIRTTANQLDQNIKEVVNKARVV